MKKPNRGGAILALGICSLVICAPLGIAAWTMGNTDLREMDAGLMDDKERQMTSAGRICGIVGACIMVLQIVVIVGALAMVGIAGISRSKPVDFLPAPTSNQGR